MHTKSKIMLLFTYVIPNLSAFISSAEMFVSKLFLLI